MRPLFPYLLEDLVFWGVFAAYGVTIISLFRRQAGGAGLALGGWRQEKGRQRRDFLSLSAIGIAVGIALGYAHIAVLPQWLAYPGATLFIVGAVLTVWSYSLLGRQLSEHVRVLPDHEVIEKGPYRYVRHPGYLGQIVTFIGLGLVLQSWLALLVILIVHGSLLAYRIHIEESFMIAEVGFPYENYVKRTRRLVPFIW